MLNWTTANYRRAAALALVVALAGCAGNEPLPEPYPEPLPAEPPSVETPPPATPEIVAPGPRPEPPPVRPQPLVAIVLSSREPAFEDVAVALAERLERHAIYDLGDRSQPPVTAFRAINDSGAQAVIAVGLKAARSAVAFTSLPTVFCQVFNYAQHQVLAENSRGVSALPPLDRQLAEWLKLDPSIRRIGAIIGDGHGPLIEEAQQAASKHGVELHLRIAASDRETLFLFNRLAGDIDGYWLFPDNRILSARVLEEIFDVAARRRIRIAVFSDSLLPLGAALSAETRSENIAETISAALQAISRNEFDTLPPILPLTDVEIVTSEIYDRPVTGSTAGGQ